MTGFDITEKDVDYDISISVRYANGVDPQIVWNELTHSFGKARDEMNRRIMRWFNEYSDHEAAEIIANTPVGRRSSYSGRGPAPLAPKFEQLDTHARSRIRRAIKKGGSVEIGRQAKLYGVKRSTILKVIGKL